jgi:hypothetical protein
MPRGIYTHASKRRIGSALEADGTGALVPSREAKALSKLVSSGTATADQVRELIGFSAADRSRMTVTCSQGVVETAIEYRRKVLAEFDELLAIQTKKCSAQLMETRTPEPTPQPQDGRSVLDIVAGQLCAECGIARAVRAIGEKALCGRCYKVELGAESTG